MSLPTVNVLEVIDGTPNRITSFNDDKAGNEQATILFQQIAIKNGVRPEDIEFCVENGVAPNTKGSTWEVFLIHSNSFNYSFN